MGEITKITWCDSTWNPWIGCTRVSPGCVHCYAESFSKRYKKAEWGPAAQRVKTSEAYWKKPLKWNKEAWVECELCGWRGKKINGAFEHNHAAHFKPARQRVFVASMADVFEDNSQVANWRGELFRLMDATPNLDWLILTKRPEKMFSLGTDAVGEIFKNWLARHPNVWGGTSVESQEYLDARVDALLGNCFKISFLSVEPMIGAVRLTPTPTLPLKRGGSHLDWVICGGESGAGCRPMELEWARALQEDCQMWDIKFFMKQLGGHPNKRDQLSDLPEDLRIREWPA